MPPAAALAGVSANSSANNVGCKAFKTEDVFNSNKKHDSKCQCKTLTKLWQTHTGSQLTSGARHVLTGTQAHSGGLLQPSSGCSSMNTARLGQQYELPLNPKQHFFIFHHFIHIQPDDGAKQSHEKTTSGSNCGAEFMAMGTPRRLSRQVARVGSIDLTLVPCGLHA